MIINGRPIVTYRQHGKHLLKFKEAGNSKTANWNDKVELVCTHNLFASDSVPDALREMAAVASGSKCYRWLYAGSINPSDAGGREFTDAEAEFAAKTLLNELGFSDDHSWLLIRHVKGGRSHFHVCASRVDPVTLRAVDLSWNYVKHEQVARRLEEHFRRRPIRGAFTRRRKKENGKFADNRPIAYQSTEDAQQSLRIGISVNQVIQDVDAAWQHALNGQEFSTLLRECGYVLARGQRREMVIIDRNGGVHSPTRRLGIRAASFRQKTSDLDPSRLAEIATVREQLRCADSADDDYQNRPEREETPVTPPRRAP